MGLFWVCCPSQFVRLSLCCLAAATVAPFWSYVVHHVSHMCWILVQSESSVPLLLRNITNGPLSEYLTANSTLPLVAGFSLWIFTDIVVIDLHIWACRLYSIQTSRMQTRPDSHSPASDCGKSFNRLTRLLYNAAIFTMQQIEHSKFNKHRLWKFANCTKSQ